MSRSRLLSSLSGVASSVISSSSSLGPRWRSMSSTSRPSQMFGEKVDVEAQVTRTAVDLYLHEREEIHQQRREAAVPETGGDRTVARAQPAAAAAVREHDEPSRRLRDREVAVQNGAVRRRDAD